MLKTLHILSIAFCVTFSPLLEASLFPKAPKGFMIEEIYTADKETQGSWVSMTTDTKGRLICGSENGDLYRITPSKLGEGKEGTKVELLHKNFGATQGLLVAFNSLYVVKNSGGDENGVYRFHDTNGDDKYDKITKLKGLDGRGGHGPHAVLLSPDKKGLLIVCGNYVKVPENFDTYKPAPLWQEDQLLPHMMDARGHGKELKAPGGFIIQTDPEGKKWSLQAMGFRNPFDAAVNQAGDIFTYDADMEYDIGSPWYRPTRICHVVSGAEYGWRSGSGKFPKYYPDSLPPVVEIGLGSPTGMLFGYEAKFPEEYRKALYICDWSYGIIYKVNLVPKGASYKATFEKFLSHQPLPAVDMCVNPKDGAMYYNTGGRGSRTGVYRIYHPGTQEVKPLPSVSINEENKTRRFLESFHGSIREEAVESVWPYLSHKDRFIRYAARTALEHQPLGQWKNKALKEKDPLAVIELALGLCRKGGDVKAAEVLKLLSKVDLNSLSKASKLHILRAYQLVMTRLGGEKAQGAEKLKQLVSQSFPDKDKLVTRELARFLVFFQAEGTSKKLMAVMNESKDQVNQIFYAYILRVLQEGWTQEERRAYLTWFQDAAGFGGGQSFLGFLNNMKNEAETKWSEEDKRGLDKYLGPVKEKEVKLLEAPPRQFVKAWKTEELSKAVEPFLNDGKRDLNNGESLYSQGLCINCHRYSGSGGAAGPDLTGVAGRFGVPDIIEAIIEPSKMIPDQYVRKVFTLKDGSSLAGKIINVTAKKGGERYLINTNPMNIAESQQVLVEDIVSQEDLPVSFMPPGLIYSFTAEDMADLIAYLKTGYEK